MFYEGTSRALSFFQETLSRFLSLCLDSELLKNQARGPIAAAALTTLAQGWALGWPLALSLHDEHPFPKGL